MPKKERKKRDSIRRKKRVNEETIPPPTAGTAIVRGGKKRRGCVQSGGGKRREERGDLYATLVRGGQFNCGLLQVSEGKSGQKDTFMQHYCVSMSTTARRRKEKKSGVHRAPGIPKRREGGKGGRGIHLPSQLRSAKEKKRRKEGRRKENSA